jgi:outer membrane lipoprotein-sorting protein
MNRTLILIILILIAAAGFAAEPDFQEILADIDRMSSFEGSDFSCLLTMVSEKPGENTNIQQAKMYRRDREEKSVILILKPEVQKGQGYLLIGDNLWFYDPESRKFAHTSLKDNFQDTDAKHSDFEPPALAQNYEVVAHSESELGRYPVYVLELNAENEEVTYPFLKVWVRKDNHLLLKGENYGLSGRLMRTSYYPSYLRIGDKYIASKMLFVDELRPGQKTQVTLKETSLNPVPDYVFTKAFVERANR